MNILITGATGSGGSYLVDFISKLNPNYNIFGTTRWHSTTSDKNIKDGQVTLLSCDLCDFSTVVRVLKQSKPDFIFHLASLANVKDGWDNPLTTINNNIMGTANLLEAIRICEINPVFQLCSTSEVYGIVNPENVPIDENCPLNPANPYAVSKLTQDCLGYVYFKSYGLKIIRTRMFSYINPRRSDLFATSFAKQIAKIERGEQEVLNHGNLNSVRTLIDVRDAMESYWYASNFGIPGEVYNIGGKTSATVGEILDKLKTMAKITIKTRLDSSLLRPVDVTLQIPDTTKFFIQTGWEPRYTLDESLEFLMSSVRM